MAPKKEQNPIQQLLNNLKIKYLDGKNPIGRAQTGNGFAPSKNASLNMGRLLLRQPYDPELRIRRKSPQQELRQFNNRLGMIERIHNVYLNPRVKLAD
jgi:hypothetical protein